MTARPPPPARGCSVRPRASASETGLGGDGLVRGVAATQGAMERALVQLEVDGSDLHPHANV
eukprot:CAMPEP_0202829632 /NCGR_PEP_ID=MMETSP1389-20130828/15635_1 /ASSEMBLY_ACC=CAM_ASM_000865 /TAXON_ID=302021 /ORGANISM="Rhodomonas sp., Strain CCMP768" /LENGTH=61 /DNA_ID=CAMNT_0049503203 /DNA_START=56 /DNA_END=241 /DNA_ORIENTATION=-